MTPTPHVDDRSHVSPRRPDGRRGVLGPHIGPVRLTPVRMAIAVAFIGSLGFIAFAILRVRDTSQIPMLSSGFGVLGIAFAAVAIGGAIEMWRASAAARPGRATAMAIVGGLAGFAAIGSFAAAAIFALLWGS